MTVCSTMIGCSWWSVTPQFRKMSPHPLPSWSNQLEQPFPRSLVNHCPVRFLWCLISWHSSHTSLMRSSMCLALGHRWPGTSRWQSIGSARWSLILPQSSKVYLFNLYSHMVLEIEEVPEICVSCWRMIVIVVTLREVLSRMLSLGNPMGDAWDICRWVSGKSRANHLHHTHPCCDKLARLCVVDTPFQSQVSMQW